MKYSQNGLILQSIPIILGIGAKIGDPCNKI